jgi:hypothetical protein
MTYKINETNLWILAFGITHKIKWLKIYHFLSFLRKQESMFLKLIWIPAGAGMTNLPCCHKSIFMVRACLREAPSAKAGAWNLVIIISQVLLLFYQHLGRIEVIQIYPLQRS